MKFRITAAAMIVVACTLIGRAMAQTAERRCRQLSDAIRAVRALGIQIVDRLEPVRHALLLADYAPFRKVVEQMVSNKTAADAWFELCHAQNERDMNMMGEQNKKSIEILLQKLGGSGRTAQEELINDCRKQLENALNEAQERFRSVAKLYTSLGFLVGLYIVVLIV